MRILAVDDDHVCRLTLEAMVTSLGHECLVASNGREAWQALQRGGVEVLISDRSMPDMDGLQLCRLVRDELASAYVYVIMATGLDDSEQVREGMLAGADEYLVKPITFEALRLRLIAAQRVSSLHRELELLNMELRTVARKDPLTGLGNRRSLNEDLETLAARVVRHGHRYAVALLDLDHFGDDNGRYAPATDETLQAVASLLARHTAAGDTSYRYGGEEFLCVFAEQSAEQAAAAIERIQAAVAELGIPSPASPFGGVLTVSAGIAELSSEHPDPAAAMRLADTALYNVKRAGRNGVEIALKPVTILGLAGRTAS